MGTSRLNTFVTPKPHVGLIRALIPFNRLVNLKGIPLLRDIPYLNRLPIIRGLCDIREIDLDDASKALLAYAMNGKTASFITPNHPEFFTDWMLDKEIASRFYPLTANWATHRIVNGMGEQGFGGIVEVDFTDVTQATDDGQAVEIRNVAQKRDALEIDQAVKRYQGAYQTCMRLRGNKGI